MKKIYSIYFSFIFIEQFIIDSLFVSDRYEIANFNYIKLIEFILYFRFISHRIIFLSQNIPYMGAIFRYTTVLTS